MMQPEHENRSRHPHVGRTGGVSWRRLPVPAWIFLIWTGLAGLGVGFVVTYALLSNRTPELASLAGMLLAFWIGVVWFVGIVVLLAVLLLRERNT